MLSQVTAQTAAEVFILCVNWKIECFNVIFQSLTITRLKHIIAEQRFVLYKSQQEHQFSGGQ